MTDQLYVATDARGVQRFDELEVVWGLPEGTTPGAETSGAELELRDAATLIEELGERIFVAEPSGGEDADPRPGVVRTSSARLIRETAWDTERAARLALDCAEHVLDEAATATLPGGATLAEVIAEARTVLERSSEHAEQRLGVLARLSAARRLRHHGDELGDAAFDTLHADTEAEIEALDDPEWGTIAAVRDAVLGAVEAVRHLALPRYVEARERAFAEGVDEASGTREAPRGMLMTPWGPITLGVEHQAGFAPSWIAARDATSRARDVARARLGDEGAAAELAWQAARLEALLSE